ncbi:MAG: outer membrane lipoprotein-sorting protein [Planctomycetota bacterium]
MTKKIMLTIFISTLLLSIGTAAAEEEKAAATEEALTVDQIVNKTNQTAYYKGADGRARVKMTITDSQGRERNRELTILRWDQPNPDLPEDQQGKDDTYCGGQKIYAYFHRPADVSKTVFMVWKYLDKDDDRWMYLPALDLVKRISSADKRTSFVGTDFYYEDVSGRNINDDVHELIKTTDDYYVLKNTPKDPKLVEFGYFEIWIHRKSFVVVKTDYYDKNNKKYRTYEALNVETIQDYPTVTKAKMTDLRTGGHTIAEYSNVKYNVGIPESIFTERYLRRPARKYLK